MLKLDLLAPKIHKYSSTLSTNENWQLLSNCSYAVLFTNKLSAMWIVIKKMNKWNLKMPESEVKNSFECSIHWPSMKEFANFSNYIESLGDISFALVRSIRFYVFRLCFVMWKIVNSILDCCSKWMEFPYKRNSRFGNFAELYYTICQKTRIWLFWCGSKRFKIDDI